MPDMLHEILDAHPDYICRFDPDFDFTYVNHALTTFLGFPKSDIVGKSLWDFIPEEARARTVERLNLITPASPHSTTLQHVKTSGKPDYVLWTNIGVFEGDRLVAYQSVGRNVSSRYKLEQSLKDKSAALTHAQDELRTVLDAVPALIWYKDDQNKILRLNKAAADSMNMSVEDVEGQNTYDLFGEAAKAYHEDDLKVFASGVPLRGQIEPYTPDDGEPGWVQTDKILLTEGADGPRLLVVASDISELKNKEAILESINKNLDDFASMVSHDLQAPLRKIGITAELMQLELGDQLPSGSQPYFDDIADGIDHMRGLIRSFLKFMRANPDGVSLNPINLTEVLRQVSQSLQQPLTDAKASLTLPDRDIYVRGDADLLNQVFNALISNAIKYRAPDRPLKITVELDREDPFWVINICDNGQGVAPNLSEQIFELFGRAKPEPTVEGNGIGLALCRRIITLHGGTIGLIDQHKTGSCFQIKLYRGRIPSDG